MKIPFRSLSLLILLVPAGWSAAQTPELSADSPIAYSEETGMLIATGNAVFRDENTTVEADEIRYNRDENQIEASGNVRVTRAGGRLLAETIFYDTETRSFSAENFRAGYPPLFIEGESFEGDLDEVRLNDIAVYFREPVTTAPRLSIRQGDYLSEEYLRGQGIRLDAFGGIGLPLPGITYVFGTPSIEVDLSAGYGDNLGAYVQSAWMYPFSPRLSLGGNLDGYTERGILIGPALKWRRPDGTLSFYLNTGWIHDHSSEERGFDVLGKRIEQDRGFVEFRTQARSEDGRLQFQARGTFLADSETLRDFRDDRYFENFQPDHFLDFTWQQDSFLLNLFSRAQLNDAYRMVERLPEVRAELLPMELGSTGFYLQAAGAATRYRLQEVVPGRPSILFPAAPLGLHGSDWNSFFDPDLDYGPGHSDLEQSAFSNRLDATATVTRPFHGPSGIRLVLRAGARWTHWDPEDMDSDERLMGELGADLSREVARTFPVGWERFDIEHIRHVSRMFAAYRWHPWDADKLTIPAYDVYAYHPAPPVLDLADLRHLDGLRDWSVGRIGWVNTFHAAGENEPFREFMSLGLYQDILFSADRGHDEWDAFYTDLTLTPVPWFQLRWAQKFRTEGFEAEAAYLSATLRSADLWTLEFRSEYLDSAIEQYALLGTYRINENLGLLAALQYDSRLDKWTDQRYGISRRFGNVWQLELYVNLTDDNDRRDDFGVGLRLRWLAF